MTDLVSQLVGALELCQRALQSQWSPYMRAGEKEAAAMKAAATALSEAKAGGWVSPYDSVPQPDQPVLVWSRQTWETAPSLKLDTWAMQREAPLSFSSATIETGYGWDDHENFESVIAWQPLPAPPAQRGEG